MGRITVIKDGKDGVGIKGADTIFAVYTSDSAEPADDYKGWKTLFSDLALLPDCYVWTAIKVTNTNDKTWLTGKRCLGSCKDFANITELYALGSSSKDAPTEGWKETYSPVKGYYLWAKNELTFQKCDEKRYTTPVCIGYFANDGINGTKFTPKGMANGHYSNYAAYKDAVQLIPGETYLVDTVTDKYSNTSGPVTITYDRLMTGNEVISVADEGDAYNVNGTLWVAVSNGWVDFGDIQGPGGDAGEDAPWVLVSTNPIVFESDDKGVAKSETKQVDVTVYLGSSIITQDCNIALVEQNDTNYDVTKASISGAGSERVTVSILSTGIKTKLVGGYDISCPNSSVALKITYQDYVIRATINIVVDTSLVDGYFRTSIKGIEAQYTKMETTVENNTALLTVHQSNIDANAEEIKTKVAQTDYDGDNKAREERFSAIEQKADSIEQTVTRINDLTGQWEKSGIVTKADFSTMYSEAVSSDGSIVKRSEIGTFVTKDADGNIESGVKINAENVNINAEHKLDIKGDFLTVNTTNFQLEEDGTMTARGANLSGFVRKSKTLITQDTVNDYVLEDITSHGWFDIVKAGSWVEFHLTSNTISIFMPSIYNGTTYEQDELDYVRSLIGSTVIIYNKGTSQFGITGNCAPLSDPSLSVSFGLTGGQFAILECKVRILNGTEDIYWEYIKGNSH